MWSKRGVHERDIFFSFLPFQETKEAGIGPGRAWGLRPGQSTHAATGALLALIPEMAARKSQRSRTVRHDFGGAHQCVY